MNVEFDKSFLKSLDKINDKRIYQRVINTIEQAEKAKEIKSLKKVKKLTGFKNYYRIRIGDYRLGFEEINKNTIRLIILLNRKDFYRRFP